MAVPATQRWCVARRPDFSTHARTVLKPFAGSAIVVGVRPGHDQVWERAAEIAVGLSSHLVCAYVDPSTYLVEWTPGGPILPLSIDPEPADEETALMLAAFTGSLQLAFDGTGVSWSFRRMAGDPVLALSRLSESVGASMLVVGSKRSRLVSRAEERISGSIVLRLLTVQTRPVLAVPVLKARQYSGNRFESG